MISCHIVSYIFLLWLGRFCLCESLLHQVHHFICFRTFCIFILFHPTLLLPLFALIFFFDSFYSNIPLIIDLYVLLLFYSLDIRSTVYTTAVLPCRVMYWVFTYIETSSAWLWISFTKFRFSFFSVLVNLNYDIYALCIYFEILRTSISCLSTLLLLLSLKARRWFAVSVFAVSTSSSSCCC